MAHVVRPPLAPPCMKHMMMYIIVHDFHDPPHFHSYTHIIHLTTRYVLISGMKSIMHFGLMRLEDLADEDNHDQHNRGALVVHDTSSIVTLLRYSSHLVLITGVAVMSAKFWTNIFHVSGRPFGQCTLTLILPLTLTLDYTPHYRSIFR